MIDHHWHGSPEAVAAAVLGLPDIIGPRTLDGIAYVCVRADAALGMPAGLSETGLELSSLVLGVWA
jgi:hypothetical protein